MTPDTLYNVAAVTPAAERIMVQPIAFLAAVRAVSIARRGNDDYTARDIEIAERGIEAFLLAVTTQTGR